MPADIHHVALGSWTGGLNLDTDHFEAQANELVDGINFDIGARGAISKRKGYTTFIRALYNGVPQRLAAATSWKRQEGSSGTTYHIGVGEDGRVYSGTTSLKPGPTIGPQTKAGYQPTIAALNKNLYVSSLRSGTPQKFVGNKWVAMTHTNWTTAENQLDELINKGKPLPSGRLPRCRKLISAYGRLWAFSPVVGSTIMRTRMYYSGYEADPAFDPEVWPSQQYEEIGRDDGQDITAAVPVGENTIVVVKERSIYLIVGRTQNEFYITQVSDSMGTEAGETAVEAEGKLIFFDPRSGVWTYDGANFIDIDRQIRRSLLEGINPTYAWRSTAVVHNNKYYLSVPWGGSSIPNRTFIYDLRLGAWTQYNYGFRSAYEYNGLLLATAVRNTNNVMRLNHGHSDNGAAYPFNISFAWMVPEELGARAFIRRVVFALSPTGDFNVEAALFKSWSSVADVTQNLPVTSTAPLVGAAKVGTAKLGPTLRQIRHTTTGWSPREPSESFQFRLSNNQANQPVQVNQVSVYVTPRRRNRGTD